eukprot:gnl/MRDRNA2_/MRDRNA2_126917_c0_seq1.p1 gnl/MRDRNA2_/MRDRNA2_126917_c0~~gnl/MRDRNA2_/MRDRNA2_126917_c0_seq1.p1  ORF type:complete len:409 (+),score=87.86 gnl/MRDRNA2_/MRDRNA2_126917_c0_seq1:119-1345(+)
MVLIECTCGFSCGSEVAFERHQRRFADSDELHMQKKAKGNAPDKVEGSDVFTAAAAASQYVYANTPQRQVSSPSYESLPTQATSSTCLGTTASPIARARGVGGKSNIDIASNTRAEEAERWASIELKKLRERVGITMDRMNVVMSQRMDGKAPLPDHNRFGNVVREPNPGWLNGSKLLDPPVQATSKELELLRAEASRASEFEAEAHAAQKETYALQLECRRFRMEAERAESIAAAERGRAAKMQSELEAQAQQVAEERRRALLAESQLTQIASQVAANRVEWSPELEQLRREASRKSDPVGWEHDLLADLPSSNDKVSLPNTDHGANFNGGYLLPKGVFKSPSQDRALPRFGAEHSVNYSLPPIEEGSPESIEAQSNKLGSPGLNGWSPSQLNARTLAFDSPSGSEQ